MVDAYLDDSHDPERKRYSAVGGLIATQAVWRPSELLWEDATFRLKEPFHSTDCECQQGQFKEYSKTECDELMAKLVGLIHQRGLTGWGAIVNVADYRSVFPASGEYDPYFLAVKHTISCMAQIASLNRQDVKLWCEESERTEAEVNRIYVAMKGVKKWKHRSRLAGIGFVSKRLVGTQAADLIAREGYKHFDNLGVRRTRKPMLKLSEQVFFDYWGRKDLEALRDFGPNDMHFFVGEQDPSRPGPFRIAPEGVKL